MHLISVFKRERDWYKRESAFDFCVQKRKTDTERERESGRGEERETAS